MKILVACEESQRVTIELRKRNHEAYSCDLEDESGGHPEWHIQQDVLPLLNGNCDFITMDGQSHHIEGKWDAIIAFPPCTYLTCAGNCHFNITKYGEKAKQRFKMREEAANFFLQFINADCDKIAVENPVGYMNSHYRKPDQIIYPYYFGEPYSKRTCLWLKGLPKLIPTNILTEYQNKWVESVSASNQKERAKLRSKTFLGIAQAMAQQWFGEN